MDWLRQLDWSVLFTTHLAAILGVTVWLPLAAAFLLDALGSRRQRSALARLGRPSASARLDVAYMLVDLPHLALLHVITPLGVASFVFVRWIPRDVVPWDRLGPGPVSALVTAAAALVAIDFLDYWTHRLLHRSRLLWPFHELHHAATEMTVLTGVRLTLTERHLIELVRVAVLLFLGLSIPAIAVVLVVRSVVDALQHSNLGWTYGPLGFLLISPANHRIHHSADQADWDTNYGNLLAIWDHLFGTAHPGSRDLNGVLTAERLPEIGSPEAGAVARGVWMWPVLSDAYLWTQLVRGAWLRPEPLQPAQPASAPPGSGTPPGAPATSLPDPS